jgi:hypothetical protein
MTSFKLPYSLYRFIQAVLKPELQDGNHTSLLELARGSNDNVILVATTSQILALKPIVAPQNFKFWNITKIH